MPDVAQVKIASQYGSATSPCLRQIFQPHFNFLHAHPVGIDHAPRAHQCRRSEKCGRDPAAGNRISARKYESVCQPAQNCGKKQKIQCTEPHGRDPVKCPHKKVVIAKREQRGPKKAEAQNRNTRRQRALQAHIHWPPKQTPRFVHEPMRHQHYALKNRRDDCDSRRRVRFAHFSLWVRLYNLLFRKWICCGHSFLCPPPCCAPSYALTSFIITSL